ncbi:MAG: Rieske 2Fe-2S domain-containing protein [Micromonosporaceae bacterium]|nr:Rieske 2Fe-2S domain-containing protein [Micromonosporaceae bacterium]
MGAAKRRTVLLGVGAAGVSAAAAACGSDGQDTSGADKSSPPPAESPADDGPAALATLDDVPVGGGVVLSGEGVVLTQPTEGEVKGFSAKCTHKGCTLASVTSGMINCTCHGSRFNAADGSVEHGPATRSLPEVKVKVEGDEVFRA